MFHSKNYTGKFANIAISAIFAVYADIINLPFFTVTVTDCLGKKPACSNQLPHNNNCGTILSSP